MALTDIIQLMQGINPQPRPLSLAALLGQQQLLGAGQAQRLPMPQPMRQPQPMFQPMRQPQRPDPRQRPDIPSFLPPPPRPAPPPPRGMTDIQDMQRIQDMRRREMEQGFGGVGQGLSGYAEPYRLQSERGGLPDPFQPMRQPQLGEVPRTLAPAPAYRYIPDQIGTPLPQQWGAAPSPLPSLQMMFPPTYTPSQEYLTRMVAAQQDPAMTPFGFAQAEQRLGNLNYDVTGRLNPATGQIERPLGRFNPPQNVLNAGNTGVTGGGNFLLDEARRQILLGARSGIFGGGYGS